MTEGASVVSQVLLCVGAIEVLMAIAVAGVMAGGVPPVTGAPWLVPATMFALGALALLVSGGVALGGSL